MFLLLCIIRERCGNREAEAIILKLWEHVQCVDLHERSHDLIIVTQVRVNIRGIKSTFTIAHRDPDNGYDPNCLLE